MHQPNLPAPPTRSSVSTGDNGALLFYDYWSHYCEQIANERNWYCDNTYCHAHCATKNSYCQEHCSDLPSRMDRCMTLHSYDRYAEELTKNDGPYISPMNKPLNQITFDDFSKALTAVKKRKNYAPGTLGTIQSMVAVVFRFAEARNHAYNIMRYATPRVRDGSRQLQSTLLTILSSSQSKTVVAELIKKERERYTHKTRSLTTWQLERLGKHLDENIITDGRYCLLAIMLYAGVRPAEGRALLWSDIVPYRDHPGFELHLSKIRDKKGNLKNNMKTQNAYRRIPVHCELQGLLQKRKNYLLQYVDENELSNYPICCFENQLDRPCRDYEAALLASQVFSQVLKMKAEEMYVYMLESEFEKLTHSPGVSEKDQHLTLYVLRRNWFTWLNSQVTGITLGEKLYLMGHEEKEKFKTIHPIYNDENRLCELKRQIDHCIVCLELHQKELTLELLPGNHFYLKDRGISFLHLSKEVLTKGCLLSVQTKTNESGDKIILCAQSALGRGITLTIRDTCTPFPLERKVSLGVNTEYANWMAHRNPTYPEKYRNNKFETELDPSSGKDTRTPGRKGDNRQTDESDQA